MSVDAETTAGEQLWGGETTKAVDNFPVSGERVPVPVVRWLGRIKSAAAEANGALGQARRRRRRADRRGRHRRRRGQARRPVPDRRLPDRLGHLVEHERQRGDRQPRRRRRPPERPRQHGPVVERRLPQRGAPGGARRGHATTCCRRWARWRSALDAKATRVQRRRQGRPHAPDGRGPGHPRPGVRRLRRAGAARRAAGRGDAAPGRPDPARRHRHRHRPQHPSGVRRQGAGEARRRHRPRRSRRRSTRSRRRATATRWSSCRAR